MLLHPVRTLAAVAALAAGLAACAEPPPTTTTDDDETKRGARCSWMQWAGNAAHTGEACVGAQELETIVAQKNVDPFVAQEVLERGGEDGPLLVHYQVPLIDGDDVYALQKAGTYVSCDPPGSGEPAPCGSDSLSSQVWTERAMRWRHGQLEDVWTFTSDWKTPELGSETLFQPVLTDRWIYIPGFGGSISRVDRRTGVERARIRPFGNAIDPHTFVWGGLSADRDGNIYYNVVRLDPANLAGDVLGAWLVKVTPRDRVSIADYTSLVPTAPAPTALCYGSFSTMFPRPARPWPPLPQPDGSPTLPAQTACGHIRPGRNLSPAVGRDGTVFTAVHNQAVNGGNYLVAVRPDLRPKWATSLAGLLADGCGVKATSCRAGATVGVDPDTNMMPEAKVHDASSSAPIALPDGSVLYGALTIYNGGRGHLMKFNRHGAFLGSYDFGWDVTPAVWEHDGTYSIVTKDNGYNDADFLITQLDADLHIEWWYRATNPLSCERGDDGEVSCYDSGWYPTGFEWCVNAPVVDRDGTVFATSGDGWMYAIGQNGNELGRHFLDRTRGASYTPAAIDRRGRIYGMNNGELYVLGRD